MSSGKTAAVSSLRPTWLVSESNWKWYLGAALGSSAALGLYYFYYHRKPSSDDKKSRRKSSSLKLDATTKASLDSAVGSDSNASLNNFVATTQQNAIEKAEEKTDEEESVTTSSDVKKASPVVKKLDESEIPLSESESASLTSPDLTDLTDEKREELALLAKNRGNKYYVGRQYEKAIELYTKAIGYYEPNDARTAVFYSNRAACWSNLNENEKVIEDCDRALVVDARYVKALLRRGTALEKLGRLEDALHDFTVTCIVEEFKNQATIQAADRLLNALAVQRTEQFFHKQNKENQDLPSLSFVTAYLNSFRYKFLTEEQMNATFEPKSGDALFVQAVEAFQKKQWEKANKLCLKALESEPQDFMAQALNMRGTFTFLMGSPEEAKADYEKALEIDPKYVNVHIKMASICMERGTEESLVDALKWFEDALVIAPEDADTYYHRGQIYFLVQDYASALSDYEKSIQLDPNFLFAKVQRAVAQYRLGHPDISETLFDEAKEQFPQNADVYYYHGEILLDQQKVDESLKEFDQAIRLNRNQPLPHLNKGVIYFHLKGDFERAIQCTQKALEVDPLCELAYQHLAQMYMQQGRLDEAIITFKKASEMARTPSDYQSSVMGLEAARAQMAAAQRLGAKA